MHEFAAGRAWLLRTLLLSLLGALDAAAPCARAAPQEGADLLKTDILGVFAHPDDETGQAATLAFYALGRHATVANVYCTRGEGGGNMVGTQAGAALGALREAELRDCLAALGIRYCFFLDQLDWAYTESVSATLTKWGKEATLEKLVRFVRTLRPDVIVTMNPAPTPGQHGHHQAAGVLATEAFTAAADPRRFPLQLTKEGLSVWQPRKLYFGGGSTGVVATIQVGEPLPAGQSPAAIAARALAHHRSQAFGTTTNSTWLQRPQRFTLVKSFVSVAPAEHDLLEGLPIDNLNVPSTPIRFAPRPIPPPLQLEFVARAAFTNYRKWVIEQDIEHVATQFRADLPLVTGQPNAIQLRIFNAEDTPAEVELVLDVPAGWKVEPARQALRTRPHGAVMTAFQVTPPEGLRLDSDVVAHLRTAQREIAAIARVHPLPHTRVARLKNAPALDGTDRGWESLTPLVIAPTNLFQGTVSSPADSSALFRVAHCDRVFFVDVQVADDIVVSNIAPNDIRGHWRSDSIEICLDPVGGAEHTMGCYKLGVFPFDSTGAVRGARDADANQGPIEETAPHTRLVSRRTANGYRIQAAIPFSEIGLAKGTRHPGFNLIIYDGDKAGAALGENINKSRIAWAPRPGVMGRPEDWGRLDLE